MAEDILPTMDDVVEGYTLAELLEYLRAWLVPQLIFSDP